MKTRKSKATDITQKVKREVYERDGGLCIFCGRPGTPNAHYIRRSRCGKGTPENIGTLCAICHERYDEGTPEQQKMIGDKFKAHLMKHYPDWDESKLYFDKWSDYEF